MSNIPKPGSLVESYTPRLGGFEPPERDEDQRWNDRLEAAKAERDRRRARRKARAV